MSSPFLLFEQHAFESPPLSRMSNRRYGRVSVPLASLAAQLSAELPPRKIRSVDDGHNPVILHAIRADEAHIAPKLCSRNVH